MDYSVQNAAAKPHTKLGSKSLKAFSCVALINFTSFLCPSLHSVCDI